MRACVWWRARRRPSYWIDSWRCASSGAGGTAGGKQRTDSTHVLARVRSLSNLECVGETLRAALDDLAQLAPEWLIGQITSDWFERVPPPGGELSLAQSRKPAHGLGPAD